MSIPNSAVSELMATTLDSRNAEIADNATKNNALLAYLQKRDRVKTVSGGDQILEQLSYQDNTNACFYSGFDLLPIEAQDVFTAARFPWKQAAVAVVISGRERMQNSGREALLDLLEERIGNAEGSLANLISAGIYSDGTGYGGNQITGLDAAVPLDPTTGTYGGIDRASWSFWRPVLQDAAGATSVATIQTEMTSLFAQLVRGSDKPNLIVFDSNLWTMYNNSLQAIQRFTDADEANLGFSTVKFMNTPVVLDGGIGGYAPTSGGFFLNTKYLKWRPHKDRNFVTLDPESRSAVNQDASAKILGFMGNLTCSNQSLQGRFKGT
jgi:hypothetical protein